MSKRKYKYPFILTSRCLPLYGEKLFIAFNSNNCLLVKIFLDFCCWELRTYFQMWLQPKVKMWDDIYLISFTIDILTQAFRNMEMLMKYSWTISVIKISWVADKRIRKCQLKLNLTKLNWEAPDKVGYLERVVSLNRSKYTINWPIASFNKWCSNQWELPNISKVC